MTGNRIELEGRPIGKPEFRLTPAGTAVLRFTLECGAQGEELRLGIVMTGERALPASSLLQPDRGIKVVGRLRALRIPLADAAYEVVAESIEREEGN